MHRKRRIYAGLAGALILILFLALIKTRQKQPRLFVWYQHSALDQLVAISFAKQDRLLSVHANGQVREWDVESRSLVKTTSATLHQNSWLNYAVASPDGHWGVAGKALTLRMNSPEYAPEPIFVWDLRKAKQMVALTPKGCYFSFQLSFSSDGTLLALGGRIWPSATKTPIPHPYGRVEIWDWRHNRLVWSHFWRSPVTTFAWGGQGNLVVGSGDVAALNPLSNRGGQVTLWNRAMPQRSVSWTLRAAPLALSLSSDAKWVAVSEESLGSSVRHAQTGALYRKLQALVRSSEKQPEVLGSPDLYYLAFSSDDRVVAGIEVLGRTRVWNLADSTLCNDFDAHIKFTRGAEDPLVNLSDDGYWLAIGQFNKIVAYPLY